jgi:pilus assembly protein CpaD
MNKRLHPLAIPLLLLLAACRAAVAEYSEAEAPKQLTVDSATSTVAVRFVPHSDRLVPGEAVRLQRMAAIGEIAPADRVSLSVAGSGPLTERRSVALRRELLQYGITVDPGSVAPVAPDTALVEIGRYLVTLPRCPNWSQPPAHDFTNATSSNFGCATATNLGMMVAKPGDLVAARTLAPAPGQPAAAAVNTYLNNKIQLPSQNTSLPLATSGQAPAAGAGAPGAAAGGGQP